MLLADAVYDSSQGSVRLDAGYLMIEQLKIEHFRCYPSLHLEGLQRVNVVVGQNGSGKTALLESIFIAASGSPEVGLRLKNFRGMGDSLEVNSTLGLRELWEDLFYRFDQFQPVRITLVDSKNGPRSLKISLTNDETMSLPLDGTMTGDGMVWNMPIEFEWSDLTGTHVSRPILENGRITFPAVKNASRANFYAAQFRLNPEETAKRISALNKKDSLDGMVDVLGKVYPRLLSVSVEHSGGSWQTFVKLKNSDNRIPIGLYSAGASKFVSLLMGITASEGGTVLVDEIENGFYYERMADIWQALYTVAQEFRCQLFVTTHSMECLRALLPVLEQHGKHFSLLKTRMESGIGSVTVSSGRAMISAISQDVEVR